MVDGVSQMVIEGVHLSPLHCSNYCYAAILIGKKDDFNQT